MFIYEPQISDESTVAIPNVELTQKVWILDLLWPTMVIILFHMSFLILVEVNYIVAF